MAGVEAERDVEEVLGAAEEGTGGVKERRRDKGFH